MTRLQTTLTPLLSRRTSLPSLFDRFFGDWTADQLPETFTRRNAPAMNVAETDTAITLAFEMPGLNEEDISVEVSGDQLVVNADRKFESEKKDKKFHRVEHQYGAFTRSVTLPREVDAGMIQATYKQGVLTIEIPKTEPTSTQKISVKGE